MPQWCIGSTDLLRSHPTLRMTGAGGPDWYGHQGQPARGGVAGSWRIGGQRGRQRRDVLRSVRRTPRPAGRGRQDDPGMPGLRSSHVRELLEPGCRRLPGVPRLHAIERGSPYRQATRDAALVGGARHGRGSHHARSDAHTSRRPIRSHQARSSRSRHGPRVCPGHQRRRSRLRRRASTGPRPRREHAGDERYADGRARWTYFRRLVEAGWRTLTVAGIGRYPGIPARPGPVCTGERIRHAGHAPVRAVHPTHTNATGNAHHDPPVLGMAMIDRLAHLRRGYGQHTHTEPGADRRDGQSEGGRTLPTISLGRFRFWHGSLESPKGDGQGAPFPRRAGRIPRRPHEIARDRVAVHLARTESLSSDTICRMD